MLPLLLSLLCAVPEGESFDVELHQAIDLAPGDRVNLKGSTFSARYDGTFSKTECATPTNCGIGYLPQAQFTVTGCDAPCPFVVKRTGPAGRTPQSAVVSVQGLADRRSTLADCQKRTGVARDACLSGLSMLDSQTDAALCTLISAKSPAAREFCAAHLGPRIGDDLLCRTITQREAHNRCLWDAVKKTKNLRACEAVIDGTFVFQEGNMNTRAGCTTSVLDGFLGGKAKPELCKGVVDPVVKAFCIAWTASPATPLMACDGLSEEAARAHCHARRR